MRFLGLKENFKFGFVTGVSRNRILRVAEAIAIYWVSTMQR